MTELATRGTSNTNARGSSYERAARRKWLIETYRANVDVFNGLWTAGFVGTDLNGIKTCPLDEGDAACRCYRCGTLLIEETLTVDRIKPGCEGGTYRRDNIRPACGPCNIHTGNQVRDARRKR